LRKAALDHLAQASHNIDVLAIAKDATGNWRAWRVGRRRLAWCPRYRGWFINADDDHGILLVVNLIPFAVYLLSWIAALAATIVTWPWRAMTGRWLVVAYMPDPDGGDGLRRARVRGRVNADALARQWLLAIKQHGEPEGVAHTARPQAIR
jgi:hypothetical protein